MAEEASRFGWIADAAKTVAGIALVGLVGVGAGRLGLAPVPGDLTDTKNWPLWLAVVVLGFAYGVAWRPVSRAFLRWRVPRASGSRLAVLLARLDGDSDGRGGLRETVREAIKRELADAVEVVLWPEALRLADGSDADAEARALRIAHGWLRDKGCDVLVWGRVKASDVLSLRFTVAEKEAKGPESYKLTETLELPVGFVSGLGAAIAARIVASAAPAVHMSGHYIVPLMRKSAERLQPIVERLNPSFDSDTRGALFHSYGLIRGVLGEQGGARTDLEKAVAAYRAALEGHTRARVPLQWAMTQNNLGAALQALGERESGTAGLEEAVAAYRAALEEYTRERVPLDWATMQNNLGNALSALGERESGTARLEEAVAAYRAALEEYVRERVPLQWAMTQNNLGTALGTLGARESGTARLEEAVAAYRAALEERTRQRVPLQWAMTQNNLGNALWTLGEQESGTARLEEAVAAYRAALEEYTRERVPLQWAMTQNNLGAALRTLGARESGAARLEEAVAAYRAALEEYTRERVPLDWAMTQNNLGTALSTLGGRESGTARLEEAVAAYRAALEERARERVPFLWAQTQENLASALLALFDRTAERKHFEAARDAVDGALEEYRKAEAEYFVEGAERLRAEILERMK